MNELKAAEEITLLVLERGAEWPSWGTGIRMKALNSAVEAQTDGESREEFQTRVAGRLALIKQQGMNLKAAGYACALEGESRRESRQQICASLLHALDGSEGSEVVLAGGSWDITGQEGAERSQLIELWGELSHLLPGRTMSLRFEDPPKESGVFRAAANLSETDLLEDAVAQGLAETSEGEPRR